MVVNFLEEEVSIIGSEIFMNPAASEELTFGYFVSKDLDLLQRVCLEIDKIQG